MIENDIVPRIMKIKLIQMFPRIVNIQINKSIANNSQNSLQLIAMPSSDRFCFSLIIHIAKKETKVDTAAAYKPISFIVPMLIAALIIAP